MSHLDQRNQNIHKKCFKECIHFNNKCPFCRHELRKNSIIKNNNKDYFLILIVLMNFMNIVMFFINNNSIIIYWMNNECSICFEINDNTFKTTCCSQSIHEECFKGCEQINNRCPFCRKEIQIIIIPKDSVNYFKLICCLVSCFVLLGIIFFPFVNNTIILVKNGK